MTGGNLLAYSALTTKIKAMHSKLLTNEQYEELAHFTTVADAFAYLQKLPYYEELFADIDPSTIHRGQIEWLLNFSTYSDFSKIYCFAQKRQRKYLNLYFMRYEIQTLKRYMRAMLDPRQSTSISVIENDFEKHSKIDTQKLSQTTTMEEFINCLKGSPRTAPRHWPTISAATMPYRPTCSTWTGRARTGKASSVRSATSRTCSSATRCMRSSNAIPTNGTSASCSSRNSCRQPFTTGCSPRYTPRCAAMSTASSTTCAISTSKRHAAWSMSVPTS